MAETKLIVNLTSGQRVCISEVADRPLRRLRGLMGRRGLPAGEGLLVSPAPAIHTAFMRFPIDALFLDRDLRVLRVVEQLHPWRMASRRHARSVLELSAGECARRGIGVGDRLEVRERGCDDSVSSGSAVDAMAPRADELEPGSEISLHQQRGNGLAPIQPLRVLVVSSDRPFRTATSLLLGRRNCSVTTTANSGRILELIVRERADVVLIDDSQEPAAATLSMVEALTQPIGVVLVSDEARPEMPDLPVFTKWAPFEDLLAAVEAASTRRQPVGGSCERR